MAHEEHNVYLDAARRRVNEALYIVGWPIGPEYSALIRGESTAERMLAVSRGIAGVLRTEAVLRARNRALRTPGCEDIGKGQIKLVQAREQVVDLRISLGYLTAGLVIPDSAIAETGLTSAEEIRQQRARLNIASITGWDITVVPRRDFAEAVEAISPGFGSSYVLTGMPGHPGQGAYVQVNPADPLAPHELWLDDGAGVQRYTQLYEELAARGQRWE